MVRVSKQIVFFTYARGKEKLYKKVFGFYPRPPRPGSHFFGSHNLTLQRLWWGRGRASRGKREKNEPCVS